MKSDSRNNGLSVENSEARATLPISVPSLLTTSSLPFDILLNFHYNTVTTARSLSTTGIMVTPTAARMMRSTAARSFKPTEQAMRGYVTCCSMLFWLLKASIYIDLLRRYPEDNSLMIYCTTASSTERIVSLITNACSRTMMERDNGGRYVRSPPIVVL